MLLCLETERNETLPPSKLLQLFSCCVIRIFPKSVNIIHLVLTIQMKATEPCSPLVLFIILYNVVLTFEFVDKILKCDHSNKSY